MELSQLKNLVRDNGDKIIFMENGEPELVMMSFAEYEKLARASLPESGNLHGQGIGIRSDTQGLQDSREDMMHETEFMAPSGAEPVHLAEAPHKETSIRPQRSESSRLQDIRLEDLPI